MAAKKIAIRVSTDVHAQVKAYAAQHGISNDEAADRLLNTAFGRLAALARYAEQRAAKPKKKTAKKAKKATSKKSPRKRKTKAS